ncbi:MAG TPA: hypothetical protein VKF40_11545 [Burkholderiales bacterium]|nr:hypothetical protein [Burkholderiales bacterium]
MLDLKLMRRIKKCGGQNIKKFFALTDAERRANSLTLSSEASRIKSDGGVSHCSRLGTTAIPALAENKKAEAPYPSRGESFSMGLSIDASRNSDTVRATVE